MEGAGLGDDLRWMRCRSGPRKSLSFGAHGCGTHQDCLDSTVVQLLSLMFDSLRPQELQCATLCYHLLGMMTGFRHRAGCTHTMVFCLPALLILSKNHILDPFHQINVLFSLGKTLSPLSVFSHSLCLLL